SGVSLRKEVSGLGSLSLSCSLSHSTSLRRISDMTELSEVAESASSFRQVPRAKVYTAIVEQIIDAIRQGLFPPGSTLPSERVLAEQLGVSRSSLREAVRVLEHAAVLDVRGGSGTYVTEESISKVTTLRARAVLAGEHSPLDLIAVRSVIEPMCAALAAGCRHAKDLKSLEQSVKRHHEMIETDADPAAADHAFHLAVAAASHNDVLSDVQHYFVDLMHQQTWSDLKDKSRSRGEMNVTFLEQHGGILQAIRDGNTSLAEKRMIEHLETVHRGLLDEVPAQ
ncbi:MAG: FadR/GntR family transcriptional regulator, partial [Nocardioidaceae bacterium]